MSEGKGNISLWKRRWGMQILICLFLGILHIFVGYEAEEVDTYKKYSLIEKSLILHNSLIKSL